MWCPQPDSNRHRPFGPRDFKSESAFAERDQKEVNELDSKGSAAVVCASVLVAFGGLGTATGTV